MKHIKAQIYICKSEAHRKNGAYWGTNIHLHKLGTSQKLVTLEHKYALVKMEHIGEQMFSGDDGMSSTYN